MKIYIKNMLSNRSKLLVKSELEQLGLHYIFLDFCEVEIMESISEKQKNLLDTILKKSGLSLLEDNKSILIEKIKNVIVDYVYYSDNLLKLNFSDYMTEKLNIDYSYLAKFFFENQGTTIEHYLLSHIIEHVKVLLIYDELNTSEIAYKMHFSNTTHLSNYFKKKTGLTLYQYKHLQDKRRKPIEKV
jgi:AraC-like DNA-binding protein